jgi:hypothetical protein
MLAAGSHVGRYEILGRIGAGATGVVYRAQDPTIRRVIALKVIAAGPVDAAASSQSPEWAGERLFKREAEAAGSLTHPHIVTLYDAGHDGEHYYLAMELIDGETIAAEIASSGRLSPARTIEVGAAVADALHFAHFRGVVHRDVKPANLICQRDGTVKVSDFGIARLAGLAASHSTGHVFVGTPSYASPEAVQGERVDGRSDQFSLGIVLYEAATGRHPFRAEGIPATIYSILTRDPAEPRTLSPEIPPALSRAIMRTLSRDPAARFADCHELAAALRAIKPEPEQVQTRVLAAAAVPRRFVLGRAAALVGLVAAVALAGVAALQWTGTSSTRDPASTAEPSPLPIAPLAVPAAKAVTLGVVAFKGLAESSSNRWVCDALRDGLNTELSQLAEVRVYSKEFLDFLVERKHLTEIEAMNELGIERMLSGSILATDDHLHAEAFITNVASGVLEASVMADGTVHDFADFRNRLVLGVIDRLRLPISKDERATLEARQRVPVDSLRLLLEAEGGGGAAAPSAPDAPKGAPGRSGRLWPSWLAWPGSALAADDPDAAIRVMLERYRQATEQGNVAAIAGFYTQFTPRQQAAFERYFEQAGDLHVTISDVEMRVVDENAIVSFTRTDEFVDKVSGQHVRMPVRLTKTLHFEDGGWRINSTQ